MRAKPLLACLVVTVLAVSLVAAVGRAPEPDVRPIPLSAAGRLTHHNYPAVPSQGRCQADLDVACYSPTQLRAAYDTAPLDAAGLDGSGRTIAVVTSFGSPTIAADLRVFDRQFGLPDPPSIETITPAGTPPPFDPTDPQMAAWAYETTLDVQYAHAFAPGARILVVATPVSETEGVTGFPEIQAAENYVVEHGLADVISQSFAASEASFSNARAIRGLRSAYVAAQRAGVSVISASGDTGATGYEWGGQGLDDTPVVGWPASDPLVTSVGGSWLQLTPTGDRLQPDVVWNDGYGASGGGVSTVFRRPAYQDGVAGTVGTRRGIPDVAMSGALNGGVLVYASYDPADTGWSVTGGTSASAPMFAGLVAVADQAAGRRLGLLNPALYRLQSGLVDITSGDNTYGGVPGYSAAPGYDLASGLGTVDAEQLVSALAASGRD